ncbi:hypothetical protein [uncultured Formosa sp.]|uniref:hypothetical protein n=1 Tax=uncultured Formosa sp. TaxID=255435 RepID=UPI002604CF0D|nr:hypothetical protein [uncultured Formosa sp.]
MKNNILYFALLLVILSSCSRKSYTALYHEDAVLEQNETTYNLSKNLLKLEIIYTLNEPRVLKNGVDEELTTSNTKITVEDPIKITKLLVADPSQTFVLKGKQLSDEYFVNPDSYDNTISSETISDVIVAQDNEDSVLSSSLTDSNKEAKAYGAVIEISDNISKIQTKIDAKFTLDLVSFYKSQFTTVNDDFKPYVKKSKVKYTVVIDPSAIDSTVGNWANVSANKILHTIYPKHIFKDNMELMDTITLETSNINAFKHPLLANQESIEGIVYRMPSSEHLNVKINNQVLKGESLLLAQFGNLETISVTDLKKNVNPNVILFKSKTVQNAIAKNAKTASINDSVEQLDFDSNETVEASQETIRNEYEKKLKHIDLLINKLQERQAEL